MRALQSRAGFLPDVIDLSTLEPARNGTWRALTPAARERIYKQCANGQQHQVCNWLVPVEDPTRSASRAGSMM